MKNYLIICAYLGFFSHTLSAQDYFIKKPGLNSTDLVGFTIDNYNDGTYLIAGLKTNGDTLLHLYVGLLNDEGTIMQYDTIPQIDYIISLNRNNDFTITEDNRILYNSTGTGTTIIYEYKPELNKLKVLDTIFIYDLGYDTYDFIELNENDYILAGFKRYESDIDFGILKIENDSISSFALDNPEIGSTAVRIFELSDSTFEVFARYKPSKNRATVRIYHFDKDLNLLGSITGDTLISRTFIKDAMKDHNGNYIYCCTRYIDNGIEDDEYIPMISQLSADGTSSWDLEIGRFYNSTFSEWYGITESVEKDGYVAAGNMIIKKLEMDTLKTFGSLAKISTEGESIWYREYSSIDTSYAYTEFRDVVATQDGYMVIGYDNCWSEHSSCDKTLSLVIVRTDTEGRIMPDSSSVVVTIAEDYNMNISAYPNPCLEQLYIQHELQQEATYFLVDMNGIIHEKINVGDGLETVKIPVSHLVAGTYFIQLRDKGGIKGEVKFVKQ